MKTERDYQKPVYSNIVAIKEMSAGNESVGSMWIETRTFIDTTPIREIMEWADNCDGKLIITWDESSKLNKEE